MIVNRRKTKVFIQDDFRSTSWEKILPGQIIKIEENEIIPADLILIDSSNEEGNCYIKTDKLDGLNN